MQGPGAWGAPHAAHPCRRRQRCCQAATGQQRGCCRLCPTTAHRPSATHSVRGSAQTQASAQLRSAHGNSSSSSRSPTCQHRTLPPLAVCLHPRQCQALLLLPLAAQQPQGGHCQGQQAQEAAGSGLLRLCSGQPWALQALRRALCMQVLQLPEHHRAARVCVCTRLAAKARACTQRAARARACALLQLQDRRQRLIPSASWTAYQPMKSLAGLRRLRSRQQLQPWQHAPPMMLLSVRQTQRRMTQHMKTQHRTPSLQGAGQTQRAARTLQAAPRALTEPQRTPAVSLCMRPAGVTSAPAWAPTTETQEARATRRPGRCCPRAAAARAWPATRPPCLTGPTARKGRARLQQQQARVQGPHRSAACTAAALAATRRVALLLRPASLRLPRRRPRCTTAARRNTVAAMARTPAHCAAECPTGRHAWQGQTTAHACGTACAAATQAAVVLQPAVPLSPAAAWRRPAVLSLAAQSRPALLTAPQARCSTLKVRGQLLLRYPLQPCRQSLRGRRLL